MSASPRNGTPSTLQTPYTGPLGDLDPAEFAGRSVITTCRGGGRGSRAAEALHEAGVDALSLHGGLRAWAEDGGAIVRDDGSPGVLD
jgi:rhodanese-related sulfurtransferase